MDNAKKIDMLDEALRLIYLQHAGDVTNEMAAAAMAPITGHAIVAMPAGKKEMMLGRLEKLMNTVSFGQLIKQSMAVQNLDDAVLAAKSGLPLEVISDLINDVTYTNNVPVKLFRQLVCQLNISFDQVKAAVLKTFDMLQTRSVLEQTGFSGFVPAFRKGYYASGEAVAKTSYASDGRELFENRESLDKYLDRLNELMNQ